MTEPNEPLVTFDRCPVCGGTERVGEQLHAKLVQEGYLTPDSPKGQVLQIQYIDQEKMRHAALAGLSNKVKIKVGAYYWDVCAHVVNADDGRKCGNIYCTRVELIEQEAIVQLQQPQPQRPGNNDPRWRGIGRSINPS